MATPRLSLRIGHEADHATGATRREQQWPAPPFPAGWVTLTARGASSELKTCQVSWRFHDEPGFGPPFELGRDRNGHHFAVVRFQRPVVAVRVFPGGEAADLAGEIVVELRRTPLWEIAGQLLARGLRVARSDPFRALRAFPRAWAILCSKGAAALPRLGIAGREGWRDDYPDWIARESVTADLPVEGPSIAVVVPVYRPAPGLLEAAIASVQAQTYQSWTLILVDDAGGDLAAAAVMAAAKSDPRVSVVSRPINGGISAATQDGVAAATADHVAFLDQDDLLARNALAEVAAVIMARPDVQLIYSDEDKIDDAGRRSDPFFKPDWDPDLLLGQNYINHLTVIRRDQVLAVGGLDPAMDGAQDHDLLLRVTERVRDDQIQHIPRVLYHWRATAGSTAQSISQKPQVLGAARRAVSSALARRNLAATVEPVENAPYLFVRHAAPVPPPRVSIIIPTRDRYDLLSLCLSSLEAVTAYAAWEVVIVDNGTVQPEALALIDRWAKRGHHRVVRDDGDFNFSRLVNRGAAAARGDVLVLLNNDIEIIQRDWLDELVAQVSRPGIGCVGAKLLYPNDTVQHAGVVLGLGGVAGHWQAGAERHDLGYGARLALTWRPSAVTAACLATPASLFRELGGLDEALTVSFNDVDYCLRARQAGRAIVWTPAAVLRHHESASRGQDDGGALHAPAETELMQRRWRDLIAADPAFNPNLSLVTPNTRLRL
jgi:GT2 family glycosyltransferase